MTDGLQEIGRLESASGYKTLEWVNHTFIGDYWGLVLEHLEDNKKLWEFHETPARIYAKLCSAEMQLHVIRNEEREIKTIGITEFQTYPTGQTDVVMYWVSGEDKATCLMFLDSLELWGAARGAQRMKIVGRPGWIRGLKAQGYGEERVTLCKPLADRMQ